LDHSLTQPCGDIDCRINHCGLASRCLPSRDDGKQIQDILARISKTPKDVIRALRDVVLGAEASAAMEKH
jgi:hypothetical protein